MNNHLWGPYVPTPLYDNRTEEQIAQQSGTLVVLPTRIDQIKVKLGRHLLRIGEKLTHEDPCLELTAKTA